MERIIKEVVATQKIEGIIVTEETKQIIRDCLTDKKTFEEARKELIEKIKD